MSTMIVLPSGTKEWRLDVYTHREDGPAIERPDGTREWYRYGRLHREDGPAVEWADGNQEWYIHGNVYSESDYNQTMSSLTNSSSTIECNPQLKVYKSRPDAVLPTKAHPSDSGYDVTLLEVAKMTNSRTVMYHTGLHFEIPEGYHLKLYARSSLSRDGYMIANNVGIIDEQYRGELLVALTKYDLAMVNLQLPNRCVQVMMEKKLVYDLVEIPQISTLTDRGTGGFGST